MAAWRMGLWMDRMLGVSKAKHTGCLFVPLPYYFQAFATYLLIAWLTSNIIFAQVVNIVSDLSWEVRGWDGS